MADRLRGASTVVATQTSPALKSIAGFGHSNETKSFEIGLAEVRKRRLV